MNATLLAHERQGRAGFQGLLARVLDISLIVGGAITASQIRFEDLTVRHVDTAFIAFAAAFALALFPVFGVYQSWRGRSVLRLTGQICLAWLVTQGCGLVLMFSLHRTDFISRLWFVYWTATTGAALIVCRSVTYAFLRRVRNAGMNLRRVAVVGHGSHCQQVVGNIQASPASGFRVSAAFDVCPSANRPHVEAPLFDDLSDFANFVRAEGLQEIWLALPLSEESMILRCMAEFRDDLVNIRFLPDVSSLALFDSGIIDLIGVPAINLVASPLSSHALLKKEIFDRAFAVAALFCLTPLMFAVAIAVKLSSPGPVLFAQRRKGADGQVFKIYKFRTMRLHASEPGVVKQASRNDTRITRVGSFLRRTSLDELPQFLNVLRGEMSVVGPRPHAIEHDELYRTVVNGYIHRYRIKPGITGWAQVNGFRGETDRIEKMQKRVEHDLYYLRNWSFGLDMKIVLATITHGFTHHNAY
ncbi:undecaprenyl-phosphate glucose phosphotransferase [Paraburkholderia domus]|uniref:undecaprenyl-phosphate glucose phosphotransferase n=1 Tax=Paraburkholderia domus TaxID=2793075 RepID=UPI00191293B5|nr:undecaprenyl-phosphate glucose phosphotransferase [Paraburkholderia domus]MBK5060027.1 undecaprenyl-phosphate glucose phosphotransferase [Burkholderia sp. R-70199]CAE6854282.1 UDP-glucose:undecaprenyl-phosphate glucose-1-phosphate transferase [Paraburkholderia domus]